MAALLGEVVAAFLALCAIAYIWLGLMWLVRVYKRWPRFSYWSATVVAILVGATTAATSGQPILYLAVTAAACAFIIVRERRAIARRQAAAAP